MKRILLCLLTIISMSGCTPKDILEFHETATFDYEGFNACYAVKAIEHQEIPKMLIKDNTIHYKNVVVVCNVNNVELKPNEPLMLNFQIGNQTYTKEVKLLKKEEEVMILPEVVPHETLETRVPSEPAPVIESTSDKEDVHEVEHEQMDETETKGEYRQFVLSETLDMKEAKQNCVAYAMSANLKGCRPIKNDVGIILYFETY